MCFALKNCNSQRGYLSMRPVAWTYDNSDVILHYLRMGMTVMSNDPGKCVAQAR